MAGEHHQFVVAEGRVTMSSAIKSFGVAIAEIYEDLRTNKSEVKI